MRRAGMAMAFVFVCTGMTLVNAAGDFEVVESGAPVRAHIVLNEFSSRSPAKRLMVNELANVHIRVRGNLMWSGYQGGNTQRRQATNSFEQRLAEEIARLT